MELFFRPYLHGENKFTFKTQIMKTKILFMSIVMYIALLFNGCAKDDFQETDSLCPEVVSTSPANAETGVSRNRVISVTFNEEMNPATITPTTFTLVLNNVPVAGTISFSGKTARFTPTASLAANQTYVGRMTTFAKDLKGNALQSDFIWSFSTGANLLPLVVDTDPANSATGVVLNKIVSGTFNTPMDATTINATTFTVSQGTTAVAGTVSYSGNVAVFTPTLPFAPNTIYTGTITNGAKNVAGESLASNYVWSFTTGTVVAPSVTATDPTNAAFGVPLNKIVSATFSTPMDPLTINGTTFTLRQGTIAIAGAITYSGNIAVFTPTLPFAPNTVYTGTITTGAKNLAGVALANNFVWSFTTGTAVAPFVTATSPANNDTGVALNKTITATFNAAMDPVTISTTTFTLRAGTVAISGTVSYSGLIATFTPSSNLSPNTIYIATITTGARNLAGTPLANNFVWNFTTAPPVLIAGAPFVNLNSVERFGIIAGVGVSNNAGFSQIRNMDVGISPGVRTSVTGFPPAVILLGAIYASDDILPAGTAAMLVQAKQDLTNAYLFAEGATSPAPALVAGDQGGLTLTPGIYKSTSTLLIQNGNLTLDAQGNPNAVWIFQIASDFTTVGGAGGSIILSGGAKASNIFWQVGSSATLGNNTIFKGNILALTSITMNANAVAEGRMLARNGSVVMTSTNIIDRP